MNANELLTFLLRATRIRDEKNNFAVVCFHLVKRGLGLSRV